LFISIEISGFLKIYQHINVLNMLVCFKKFGYITISK